MSYRVYLCGGPHCSARGAARTRQALDAALWEAGLLRSVEQHVSGCQDHCDHGPNMLVHPGACRYAGVTPERVAEIVARHLKGGDPVAAWLATAEMRRGAR